MGNDEVYKCLDEIYVKGMTEAELADALHKKRPQIPVLFCKKFVIDWVKKKEK